MLMVFLSAKHVQSLATIGHVQCISYDSDNVNMTYSCWWAFFLKNTWKASLSTIGHFQCISNDSDNVTTTYSCCGAVYIFCLSFWKTHGKLHFLTFEHVYVQCIACASDNVNMTYSCSAAVYVLGLFSEKRIKSFVFYV